MTRWSMHALFPAAITLAALCAIPSTAMAYVGPGAGLTAIGAVLAFLGGLVLAVFGFIWYPVRRLLRRRRQASQASDERR